MQVSLEKLSPRTNDWPVKVLIRKQEEAWPQEFSDFGLLFQEEEDKEGSRLLRQARDSQLAELLVLTIKAEASIYDLQKSFKDLAAKLEEFSEKAIAVWLSPSFSDQEFTQIARSLILLDNKFTDHIKSGYKNTLTAEDKEEEDQAKQVALLTDRPGAADLLHEAESLAQATALARRLVNEPANIMTPRQLAQEAQELAAETGFEVQVLGEKAIRELGMEAYWSVAKGSAEEPHFIIMRYMNNPESKEILALVGKGLCYDSGGYDLKPGSGMRLMNSDMAGSAAVIAAMGALAREQAKVNVVALVAACENMVSGNAFHNGDIIGSLAGKSIEIMSTDAEGRLTLADAVTYAWQKEKATAIVDIATLTGAVITALGDHVTGSISDSEELWQAAAKASQLSGDKVWRLPIDEDYEAKNKSERADIKNGGIRGGGSITAGLFVRAFANATPFLHLDIAGTSYNESGSDRAPKGASGVGADLLYYLSKEFFA
ncbi:MAG: leucyl aminopeptidase [Eubacteriales bacterium]|nr:leucyl aminopeptidase [Eubacteriales bacterium]